MPRCNTVPCRYPFCWLNSCVHHEKTDTDRIKEEARVLVKGGYMSQHDFDNLFGADPQPQGETYNGL